MATNTASEAAKVVRYHTRTYANQHRDRLERDHWGRTALMRDGEVIEIFDEGIEAHHAGMERFGARNFATMGIGVVSIGYRVVTPVA